MELVELISAGGIGSLATLGGTWIKSRLTQRKGDQGHELSLIDKLQTQYDKAVAQLNATLEHNQALIAENAGMSAKIDLLETHVGMLETKVETLTQLIASAIAMKLPPGTHTE